jgi:hypothetical protein
MWATRPSTIARASSSRAASPTASRRTWAVGARHPAQMGKSKLECDVGDASSGEAAANLTLRCASRMSRSISEIDVAKCRWKPSCRARMPVPAPPQAAQDRAACLHAHAGIRAPAALTAATFRPGRQIGRSHRWRCGAGRGARHPTASRADWPPLSAKAAVAAEAFGEIDELKNLRLKRPAARGGKIDRGLELDRAGRPARQRCGPLLQQTALDQQNELGAIALPGHSCGIVGDNSERWRRERLRCRAPPFGSAPNRARGFATGRSVEAAGVDRHRSAIGDVVDGEAAKDRTVMQRKKVGR